jgi:L-fucose/D-arabinose isomerase
VQGLLTMLFMTWLSGGNPPLFMDFRKVWEAWEIKALAKKLGVKKLDKRRRLVHQGPRRRRQLRQRLLRLGGKPGASVKQIMERVSMPLAERFYFPGGGNSVTFMTPGGIDGIAGRMAYSSLSGLFSLIWDEACTTEVPAKLAKAMCN